MVFKHQLYENIKSKVSIALKLNANLLFDYDFCTISEVYNFSDDVLCRLPSFDSVKFSIHRCKTKAIPSDSILDEASLDRGQFILPNTVNFPLFSNFDATSIVILRDIHYERQFTMARNHMMVLDGAFKYSYFSFIKLYILHGFFNGQSFTIIYCFLNDKT